MILWMKTEKETMGESKRETDGDRKKLEHVKREHRKVKQ